MSYLLRGGSLDWKCRLKKRLNDRVFLIFSHRSFVNTDVSSNDRLTCQSSLHQLRDLGINHLDIDLVLHYDGKDEDEDKDIDRSTDVNVNTAAAADGVVGDGPSKILVVSHPMEYKRTASHYSPCAKTEFKVFVGYLKNVYGDDFFISMEPKASWSRTQQEMDDSALASPVDIVSKMQMELAALTFSKKQCAIIINLKDVQDSSEEDQVIKSILEHNCQLFVGIRQSHSLADVVKKYDDGIYDAIMPTIEHHPRHATHKVGMDEYAPKHITRSIYWVVDTEEHLQLVEEWEGYGIVSNKPEEIISMINGFMCPDRLS